MSYELMSEEQLHDEMARIEAVLRARSVIEHKTKAERQKAQEIAEKKQKLARLKPYIKEYKAIEKICDKDKEFELKTSITIPLNISAAVSISAESYPDEIDSLDIEVVAELPYKYDFIRDAIQDSLVDAIQDLDYDVVLDLFGESNLKDIIKRKEKLYNDVEETDSWNDLINAAAEQEE